MLGSLSYLVQSSCDSSKSYGSSLSFSGSKSWYTKNRIILTSRSLKQYSSICCLKESFNTYNCSVLLLIPAPKPSTVWNFSSGAKVILSPGEILTSSKKYETSDCMYQNLTLLLSLE